ncbi:lipopolysaccharide biosynthesis protein [Algoriphagus winogradskyi]|uniref:Membrane protein involved in the export of O-antigen and teichoic acid n=1 Tax=Algoriphagus winogradskyi TaxID=237017 RepID=A0ABY1NWF7_9BACT|nr:polysaccharide biosynthesis C-terminal domain-containing protein [Algoriphagus winogradskyi]SMP20080.1 Membrane protein involved in the export of O-antigen and teichoic acid [Algoriphagus winogradskyi]
MTVIKNIKNLASDSMIYGLAGIATRVMGVVLTPLYTRVYSPEDYGVFGLVNNAYSLIALVLILSLDNSTARWFYDTEEVGYRKKIISTWFWFYLMISIVFAVFFFFTAPFWSQFIAYNSDESIQYIQVLAFSLPVSVATVVATKVLRFEKKPKSTVLLTFLQALFLIIANVVFVLVLNQGLKGAFIARLVAFLLMVPLSLYYLKRWLQQIKLSDFSLLGKMIKYSLPFLPASLSIWIINLSAIFFLNGKVSDEDLGLFQIAFAIAGFSGIVVNAFQQAWSPFAFSIIHQDNAKATYGKILLAYLLFIGSITLMASLFSLEALMIIATPAYYGAATIASILVFSSLFAGLTNIADLGSAISKKTAPLGIVYSVSSVILILLNIYLIPNYGVYGAALAVCISQFLTPVFVFYFSQKSYPIPYDFTRAFGFMVLLFLVAYLGFYFSTNTSVINAILIKLGTFGFFVLVSILIFKREFLFLKGLVTKRMSNS